MKREYPFAIIEKLVKLVAGEVMNNKIDILGINIDNCTAKEAMKKSMDYLESEVVNVIEMVTVDGLMQMDAKPEIKEAVSGFDLVLAKDKAILEAAQIKDRKFLQETEGHVFLKMFMRYLHKHHKRVYLLVESEEEGTRFFDFLQYHYGGIQIVGLAKISAQDRADDMLVNDINGGEADCVFSALSSPLQEDFIIRNRTLLDIRLWLGLGNSAISVKKDRIGSGKITKVIMRFLFKKEIEKRKRNMKTFRHYV